MRKMKRIKRIFSLLLIISVILSNGVYSFGEEEITIGTIDEDGVARFTRNSRYGWLWVFTSSNTDLYRANTVIFDGADDTVKLNHVDFNTIKTGFLDMKSLTFKDTNYDNRTIPYHAFYNGNGTGHQLERIHIFPCSVPHKVGDWAFHHADKLKEVIWIGHGRSPGDIGIGAFAECTSLESISLGYNVKEIKNNTFYNCTSLGSISASMYLNKIGDYAFYNCQALSSMSFGEDPGFSFVKDIGDYAFYNCDSLIHVAHPLATSLGEYAYAESDNLKHASFTFLPHIGAYAFYNCTSLYKAYFIHATYVDDYAFYNNTKLTDVDIPNVEIIDPGAFKNASSLRTLNLPKLRIIRNNAFEGCSRFSSLTLGETPPEVGADAFKGCPEDRAVYVPKSARNAYDMADGAADNKWHGWKLPELSDKADMLSFSFDEFIPRRVGQIAGTNWVWITVPHGTDMSSLTPTIEISPLASVTPASGVAQDFRGTSSNNQADLFHYTVRAENASTTKHYYIRVSEAASDKKDIIDFSIEGRIPSTIDESAGTISITVPHNTDVTALVPWIQVSPGASVSPNTHTIQDFTNPVIYTVTAIDGSTKQYVVKVTEENNPPTLKSGVVDNQIINHSINTPYEVDLSQIFEDADGDPLTYHRHLDDGISSDYSPTQKDFSYTPTTSSQHYITFVASDGRENSDAVYTVTLNVGNIPPNRIASVPDADTESLAVNKDYTIDLSTVFEDVNNDSLTYEVKIDDSTFGNANEIYTYTPSTTGDTVLTFRAYDGIDYSVDTYEVTLSVIEGIVTINSDITPGTLQSEVEAQAGGGNGSIVTELHVTAGGALNDTDIAYINTMVNLEVLNVASTVTVGHVGDNFCESYNFITGNDIPDFDNLREVNLPATSFGHRAFSNCLALESVGLPKVTSFGHLAFADCLALESISLPEAVTFGDHAFSRCSSLLTAKLPKSEVFGLEAFLFCNRLESLTLGEVPPTVVSWGPYAPPPIRTVYVPATAVDDYDLATDTNKDNMWEGWIIASLELTGVVAIDHDGTPQYGETLTADINGITNNTGILFYQWKRDGTDIIGATNNTYAAEENDINKAITVEVTSSVQTGAITSSPLTPEKADYIGVVTDPVEDSKTHNSITLDQVAGYEYSKDRGASWQDSSVFTGLTANTQYSFIQRVKETATHKASSSSNSVDITTNSAPANVLTGVVLITGDGTPQFGETLTANLTRSNNTGTLSYRWKRGGTYIGTNSADYTITEADIGESITVEVRSSVQTGAITSSPLTPEKADYIGVVTDPVEDSKTHNSITLDQVAGYEYSKHRGASWQDSSVFTGLTADTQYSFIQRVKETATHKASSNSNGLDITTSPAPVKPINTRPNRINLVSESDSAITVVNEVYSIDLSNVFEDADGDPLTYQVRIDGGSYNDAAEIYSYTPTTAGDTILSFRAYDGIDYSTDIYELILTAIANSTEPDNTRPNRINLVSESDSTITVVNEVYSIDLSNIFEDADGDPLTYQVRINGGSYNNAAEIYSYTPKTAGDTILSFRAYDGINYSLDIYELILTARPAPSRPSRPRRGSSSPPKIVEETIDIIANMSGSNETFTIKQDEIEVTFYKQSFEDLKKRAVQAKIERVDKKDLELLPETSEAIGNLPIYDISILVDGKKTNFESESPIIIKISVKGDYEGHKVIAVYIDSQGNTEIMEGVVIDGIMIFTTNHLSNYALMYVNKSFEDITDHWSREAVEALAAREMIKGKGEGIFAPEDTITRAEFVTLIARHFNHKAYGTDLGYTDIEEGKWYTENVWIARELGLLPKIYGTTFEPDRSITCEDMMYILYKSLESTDKLDSLEDYGDRLIDFIDSKEVSSYAIKATEYFVSRDIINGSHKNMISPKDTSTRAEVAQMLYNFLIKKYLKYLK